MGKNIPIIEKQSLKIRANAEKIDRNNGKRKRTKRLAGGLGGTVRREA